MEFCTTDAVIQHRIKFVNAGWMGASDNFSTLPIASPLSQSSTHSMDSGYLEASSETSPTQQMGQMSYQQLPVVNNQSGNNQIQNFHAISGYNDDPFHEFYNSPAPAVTLTYQTPYLSPPPAVVPTFPSCANVNPESQGKPHLVIVEQPTDKPFRFRYKSEMHGTHGSLMGVNTKRSRRTYPTVALRNFDFNSKVLIRCCLYQLAKENSKRFPHSHKLVVRRGDSEQNDPHDIEVSSQNDFTAIFQGMGIIHTKRPKIKEELYKKIRSEKEFEENRELTFEELQAIERNLEDQSKTMNLNQVCLCFQAFIRNEVENKWIKICEPIYSNVINNMKSALVGELRINRMSTYTSPASGGQEVFMFVEKVCKANIKVKFYELNEDGSVEWEDFGIFNESDVHHQYGIVLKTPPYKTKSIDAPVVVKVQLYRSSDACVSESLEFRYRPDVPTGGKRKRTNSNEFNIPTVVGSHESSSQENSSSSFNPMRQHQDTSQTFSGKFYPSPGNLDSAMEESIFANDQLPSFFGSFTATDLNFTTNDLKGFPCTPEEFYRLLDIDVGGESKLEHDGVGSARVEINPDFSSELKCSLLDKLKMLIKLFKNNFDESKLHEMMMVLVATQAETGENILLDCIQYGTLEEIRDLVLILVKYKLSDILQSKNDLDQNCFHLLIQAGCSNLLRVFLHLGVDVNQADAFGQTPLHVAVINEFQDALTELLDGSISIKLNKLNDAGFTPLHLAVKISDLSMVKLLIDAGADVAKKNPATGENVLHMAVVAEEINMELINYLIENDETMLYQENHSGMNVMQVAAMCDAPDGLIQLLSSFYDESYIRIKTDDYDDGSTTDSDEDEDEDDDVGDSFNSLFDDQCLKALCNIFDRDQKWERLLILLELEDKIALWARQESPSRCLFKYLEQTKKSLDEISEILDMLDERRAINEIDEMIVRRINK